MARKLITVLPALTTSQRERMTAAAQGAGFDARFFGQAEDARPELADAEIILSNIADLAKDAPALKWFCSSNAGIDPFLGPDAFANPEAVLTNSSGAYGVAISEHIVMVTLELMRRQPEYNVIVARREWKRNLTVRSIWGSRVTLLGTGDIGCETARRMRAFGIASLTGVNRHGANPGGLFDRIVTIDNLDRILPETDLLVMSLPGTPETAGLMNAERLSLLPDTAFLVNVGRGSALDQRALEQMLRAGRLAGAALDVFVPEPLPADDPLWDCPGLLITPHVAGNTSLALTVERIVDMFLEDFDNYCAGRPLKHAVDRKRGY